MDHIPGLEDRLLSRQSNPDGRRIVTITTINHFQPKPAPGNPYMPYTSLPATPTHIRMGRMHRLSELDWTMLLFAGPRPYLESHAYQIRFHDQRFDRTYQGAYVPEPLILIPDTDLQKAREVFTPTRIYPFGVRSNTRPAQFCSAELQYGEQPPTLAGHTEYEITVNLAPHDPEFPLWVHFYTPMATSNT